MSQPRDRTGRLLRVGQTVLKACELRALIGTMEERKVVRIVGPLVFLQPRHEHQKQGPLKWPDRLHILKEPEDCGH